MGGKKTEIKNAVEMLSFGGAQFAASIFMAFSSYYLMMFCTDVALIPAAATAVLLFCYRLFGAVDTQFIGVFINRKSFKDGKYRPYFKWCALPYAIGFAALGLAPGISSAFRIIYIVIVLLICELSWSVLHTASISMLPYLAGDDISRSGFMSFSNGSSIIAYIIIGTFMLPLADVLSAENRGRGIALALVLCAVVAVPLLFNAYYRLKERHYSDPPIKPTIKDMFFAIGRNKQIMLFFSGFCIYCMADAFKSMTTYYYVTYIMERGDLLPVVILAGLLSPLAVQPIIPRLLKRVKKENLIVFGLFAASCICILMLAAGSRPVALIVCIVLYGVFTAIVANLVFTVVASFSDEIRMRQNIGMSEILTATMNLSSSVGSAIASGASAITMAAFGYSAQVAVQSAGSLFYIRALYTLCPAVGMALAGAALSRIKKK